MSGKTKDIHKIMTQGQLTHCSMVSCQSLCNSSCLGSFCRPRSWSILYASTGRNRERQRIQNDKKGDIWLFFPPPHSRRMHRKHNDWAQANGISERRTAFFIPWRCQPRIHRIPTERSNCLDSEWGEKVKQCGSSLWERTVTRKSGKLYGDYK